MIRGRVEVIRGDDVIRLEDIGEVRQMLLSGAGWKIKNISCSPIWKRTGP